MLHGESDRKEIKRPDATCVELEKLSTPRKGSKCCAVCIVLPTAARAVQSRKRNDRRNKSPIATRKSRRTEKAAPILEESLRERERARERQEKSGDEVGGYVVGQRRTGKEKRIRDTQIQPFGRGFGNMERED
jgi:hypothetical protein